MASPAMSCFQSRREVSPGNLSHILEDFSLLQVLLHMIKGLSETLEVNHFSFSEES